AIYFHNLLPPSYFSSQAAARFPDRGSERSEARSSTERRLNASLSTQLFGPRSVRAARPDGRLFTGLHGSSGFLDTGRPYRSLARCFFAAGGDLRLWLVFVLGDHRF